MANSKISALTSATTPLAGTETLPVVQSSTTKKVAVSDLTAGRAVNAFSMTCTSTISTTISGKTASFDAVGGSIYSSYDDGTAVWRIGAGIQAAGQFNLYRVTGAVNAFTVDSSGNFNLGVGNLVPSTAAKGINFTANTAAAGMTSQLLNWYEEGTWTPTQGAGLTVVGSFSSGGTYTRIGRLVTVNGHVDGSTSVVAASGNIICGGLPYASSGNAVGSLSVSNINQRGSVVTSSTNIYSAQTTTTDTSILFTVSYIV